MLHRKALGLPVPGPELLLSSVPQPRNTSTVSWSVRSIMSICSSTSTFTSMEEMLPKGAAEREASKKVSARQSARQRALVACGVRSVCPTDAEQDPKVGGQPCSGKLNSTCW